MTTKQLKNSTIEVPDGMPYIGEEEYTGTWVYAENIRGTDGVGDGVGYFSSITALFEWCLENDVEPPDEVEGTDEIYLRFDADSIIEEAAQNSDLHEGAIDSLTKEKTAELQALLAGWAKTCGVVSYTSNGVKILPTEDRFAQFYIDLKKSTDARAATLAAMAAAKEDKT